MLLAVQNLVTLILSCITQFFGHSDFLLSVFIAPFVFFIIRQIANILNYVFSLTYKRW